MPAFWQNSLLEYFAALQDLIPRCSPVRGDARLEQVVTMYAGARGNLRFPLDVLIPYAPIERITNIRLSPTKREPSWYAGRSRASRCVFTRLAGGSLRELGAPRDNPEGLRS